MIRYNRRGVRDEFSLSKRETIYPQNEVSSIELYKE
jgi:hypothetical protein